MKKCKWLPVFSGFATFATFCKMSFPRNKICPLVFFPLSAYTHTMNVVRTLCFALAASAALARALGADEPEPAARPYTSIIARNIFGLLPPPPPVDPNVVPADPPPKITANGITSIFGQLNALYKVDFPAKDGQPAKQNSYMLTQGQRQDDIEVLKIDEQNATITFDNHGTTQEIPLVPAQAAVGSTAPGIGIRNNPFAPAGPGTALLGRRRPGFPGGLPVPTGAPNPTANPGFGQNGLGQNNPTSGGQSGDNSTGIITQPGSDLTLEQQAILIEAERARLETMDKPAYNPNMLPPTPLTPRPASGGEGGDPGNVPMPP
jgi:hypothetical protein